MAKEESVDDFDEIRDACVLAFAGIEEYSD